MLLTLTLQLILAHLLGDFLFQPTKWVQHKMQFGITSSRLYMHTLVHFLLLLTVLLFNTTYLTGILVLTICHFLIDVAKIYAQRTNPRRQRLWFLADQLLHAVSIGGVVYLYFPFSIPIQLLSSPQTLLMVVFVLINTSVAAVIIKVLTSYWTTDPELADASLPNAGTYIGILERLFVFGFVIMHLWQGIGFLLAAKSVFRFGDLNNAKNRKLTEYVLIGTLLSFGLAILSGVVYTRLLEMLTTG